LGYKEEMRDKIKTVEIEKRRSKRKPVSLDAEIVLTAIIIPYT